MKPFSGGQLLDERRSPFGQALTPFQCIKYALDKLGVLTVLPGAQSVAEVGDSLAQRNTTIHWKRKRRIAFPVGTVTADALLA